MADHSNEKVERSDFASASNNHTDAASEHTAVAGHDTPPNEKVNGEGNGAQAEQAPSRHVHMAGEDSTGAPLKETETVREQREREARERGLRIITEEECYEELGFSFSTTKKWMILTVIFIVQVSMNFNTSLYSNALTGISDEFGVSTQAARVGAAIFLVTYAFGCELWAPWSEELGRKPVLQLSLFLVNIWQVPVGVAKNFATIIVFRALGGLSSAGGSVTLGMIADMWEADNQQYAVAFVVFSSVGGSVLGPVVGGFVEYYCNWRWNIWIQLIFGGVVQIMHFFLVPETRTTLMMDKIAKRRRTNKDDPDHDPTVYGPNEREIISIKERFSKKEILITWIRPFKMFLTEPIVLTLSLLSGFSDALIFMFIQSFSLVYGAGIDGKPGYDGYGFNAWQVGLSFLPILVGYFIAWALFIPAIKRNIHVRNDPDKKNNERAQYESRLSFLLWTAPCLPIGLIGFAWTCSGPPLPWIASMIFAAVVGIANYSIYMATIDYMIAAYGPYSASATGGNGWSRDFLAGVLTIPATPFFENINPRPLEYAGTILFCISFCLVIAVYVIYWKGPVLRKRSPFAQQLASEREHRSEAKGDDNPQTTRLARITTAGRRGSEMRFNQEYSTRRTMGSRQNSQWNEQAKHRIDSRNNSRANSRANSPVRHANATATTSGAEHSTV